jgi:hypothetical protein
LLCHAAGWRCGDAVSIHWRWWNTAVIYFAIYKRVGVSENSSSIRGLKVNATNCR